jgi:hypothetical protein
MDLAFATVALAWASLAAAPAMASWSGVFGNDFDVKLTTFDQLAVPGEAVTLRAKLEHQGKLGINPDMRGYPLLIQCPPLIDREVKTGKDGVVTIEVKVPADAKSVHPIKVTFPGSDHHRPAEAASKLFVWPKDARILITDVDMTVSNLAELRVPFTPNDRIPALPGAVEALTELAKTYRIIYLSARDDALCSRTCGWLCDKGFPEGPFFCRDFKIGSKQEMFKREFIADLKKRFPNVAIGVGDKPSDAGAYLSNGLRAFIIARKDRTKLPKEVVVVESWKELREQLTESNRDK